MGASIGDFSKRGGQDVSDGIRLIPSSVVGKLLTLVVGMVVAFFVLRSVGSTMKPVASMSGATNGVPASSNAIAEQWKKSNPVIEQDKQESREQ